MIRQMSLAPALPALLVALLTTAPSVPEARPAFPANAAEFERICKDLQVSNPYFGRRIVSLIEERLEAGPAPRQEALMRAQLGQEFIRLGRLEEAVEALLKARTLLEGATTPEERELRRWVVSNLAISHLIQGEAANCVDDHNAASCILPLSPEAVHRDPLPARRAGDLYASLVNEYPSDHAARWLLNVSRAIAGQFPEGVPASARLREDMILNQTERDWVNIAPLLGVDAFDLAGGAAIDDFDGDGLLDIVSSTLDPCAAMKAYRNNGDGTFLDVSSDWGLDSQYGGLNLVQADYDGDGHIDLLVLRGAWWGEGGRIRNSLLRNELRTDAGRFVDVTSAAGVAHPAYPTQTAAWADFDLDGDLDLYVGNESPSGSADPTTLIGRVGKPYPSQLFRNNGDGTFTDVARAVGVQNQRFAKGVAWGDYDDDGDPDLYVSNFGANRLYRNDRERGFVDVAVELGVTEPEGSFPTWFFDYDNDGDLDLFAADYGTPFDQVAASYFDIVVPTGHPLLYRNDGGRFTEVARSTGLTRPLLPMGANFGDLDNDGWLDFYLGTGLPNFGAILPNALYRNLEGRAFEEVTFEFGFGHLQKGHGVAFADIDNDGDQDVFEQMGGAYPYDAYANVLYENPGTESRWLVLRFHGDGANRFAIGARVTVHLSSPAGARSVHRIVGTGGSFGGSSLQLEVGLGDAISIDSVEVRWPGTTAAQTFPGVQPDRFYLARQGAAVLEPLEIPKLSLGRTSSAAHRAHRSSLP